jgi:hypothetical protein
MSARSTPYKERWKLASCNRFSHVTKGENANKMLSLKIIGAQSIENGPRLHNDDEENEDSPFELERHASGNFDVDECA